ncbi:MAG: hypothetical protein IJV15_11960 [Lachnospiraceae bacterium]|nr:hypothetical protein [Lachnospiraceae bacterium]
MKKRFLLSAIIMSIMLMLVSCNEEKHYGNPASTKTKFDSAMATKDGLLVSYEENYERYINHQNLSGDGVEVLMVYMVGSNLESESGLASEDIEEMQDSGFYSDKLKVVICTGGANYWWNDDISENEVAVYEVMSGEENIDKLTVLDGDNMSEPDTLTSFIDYVYDNYQGDCYSLILWNHGGGAVLGYGNDERYDYDSLSLGDLDTALSDSKLIADGYRFEWVGFDACLMGMLEIADLFEPYSNYLIASEELIPGEGWNYSFLEELSDGTSLTGDYAGEVIIDAYASFYDSYKWYMPEYTLSCMDLSRTNDVMDKFNDFISVAENDLVSGEYSAIARQRGNTKAFGIVDEYTCYDTVDLYNLTENMYDSYPNEAVSLQAAIKEMVIYEKSNVENANGIAIYFPYDNKDYVEEWVDEYSLCDFSETYMQFVRNFTETLSGNPLTRWDISNDDATVTVDADTSADSVGNIGSIGNFSIQLTPEQASNFATAKLEIWEIYENQDNGSYGLWINSSDVNLSPDGVLSSMISDKRFILCDSSGNKADCCAIELERGEDYATYYTVVFNNSSDSLLSYRIHIRVDSDNPNGVITGIYPFEEDTDTMMPSKQSVVFEQGSYIEPFSFGRIVKFNDDGSLAPFDEWENNSGFFYGFDLDGDLSVDMVDIDPYIEKLYVYCIVDTQGNSYVINVVK